MRRKAKSILDWIAIVFLIVAVGAVALAFLDWTGVVALSRDQSGNTSEAQRSRQNMLITFQKVDLDKYMVLSNYRQTGTEDGDGTAESSTGSATVMHVRGTVEARIDLGMVNFDEDPVTGALQRIEVEFPNFDGDMISMLGLESGAEPIFPVVFSANIDSSKIEVVTVYEDLPSADSPTENENATLVALGTVTGGMVGFMAGHAITGVPGLRQYRVLASGAGAAVGAAAGNVGMRALSNRLSIDMETGPGPIQQSHRNQLVQHAPNLMIAELISDDSLRKQFDSAARSHVRSFAGSIYGSDQVDDIEIIVVADRETEPGEDS